MDISSIHNLYKSTPVGVDVRRPVGKDEDFGSVFNAALKLVQQTNDYQIKAEEEEMKFLLGETNNPHDVQIAATEARIALQYTNAIRNSVIQSYQTIMNMQV